MKRILLIALCASTVAACSKDDDNNKAFSIVDATIELNILDKDGCDLLNPANENAYKLSEIGLYKNPELTERRPKLNDWVNEEIAENKTREDDIQLMFCESCKVFNDYQPIYYLIFHAPPYDSEMECDGEIIRYATSYLKLNAFTVDTIYTEITVSEYHSFISKILYNGEDITKNMVVVKNNNANNS